MKTNEEYWINLLPASRNSVFCFFRRSQAWIEHYEQLCRGPSLSTSQTVLKLFCVLDGVKTEIKTIPIDELTDNWHIPIERDKLQTNFQRSRNSLDVFVELGRMNTAKSYVPFLSSNVIEISMIDQNAEDTGSSW